LDANQAVSFFACIRGGNHEAGIVQSISLTNDKTHENLVISPDLEDFVMIARYSMGAKAEEWIKEIVQIIREITHLQERKIEVDLF
jgi:hypothetical protein